MSNYLAPGQAQQRISADDTTIVGKEFNHSFLSSHVTSQAAQAHLSLHLSKKNTLLEITCRCSFDNFRISSNGNLYLLTNIHSDSLDMLCALS